MDRYSQKEFRDVLLSELSPDMESSLKTASEAIPVTPDARLARGLKMVSGSVPSGAFVASSGSLKTIRKSYLPTRKKQTSKTSQNYSTRCVMVMLTCPRSERRRCFHRTQLGIPSLKIAVPHGSRDALKRKVQAEAETRYQETF